MQMKPYRMLAIYVDKYSVNTGIFDHETAVFERTLPLEKEPPSASFITAYSERLLASLDEEGMNISKLKAICAPSAANKITKQDLFVGMKIADAIAERLHIPVFFVHIDASRQRNPEQVAYGGDRLLLSLAQQSLIKRSSMKKEE
ncbi:hypothetical protein [Bacillus sp. REN10]|uniref:hypothetical protein n=1 Tax=Bacillus sp. REN10 TaxID=2782541 RepID=UPI00193C1509|nr:hypothetical protein [Bacillus sp. REN10]